MVHLKNKEIALPKFRKFSSNFLKRPPLWRILFAISFGVFFAEITAFVVVDHLNNSKSSVDAAIAIWILNTVLGFPLYVIFGLCYFAKLYKLAAFRALVPNVIAAGISSIQLRGAVFLSTNPATIAKAASRVEADIGMSLYPFDLCYGNMSLMMLILVLFFGVAVIDSLISSLLGEKRSHQGS